MVVSEFNNNSNMEYYISTKIENIDFQSAENKVVDELKQVGFGIVTEINMTNTFKTKLDVDFRPYKILGACNPGYAFKALSKIDKVGVLLPCNVVIQQLENNTIEVFAVNPLIAMQPINEPELEQFAHEVYEKINKVLESL